MAAIREEYMLADKFSATFTRLLGFMRQTSAAGAAAAQGQERLQRASGGTSAAMIQLAEAALNVAESMGAATEGAADLAGETVKAARAQDEVNKKFREGAQSAGSLEGKLKGLATTYLSFRSIKSALDWVGENLSLSNIQRNAENQLKAVLANIGAQGITIPVTADLQVDVGKTMSAFDAISAKASAIQNKGIYGDESMLAGAAEFATYFSDANAILSMMDTLSDYAMGMSGGGALNKEAMVEYATGLGKIMSGSYDAMTKKGFEFSKVQKAIIEGTATESQIVATLGKEYLDMSHDMQAAAVINSVVAESWGGLYEAMSDTPEGKIIQLQNRLGDMREMLGDRIYPAVLQVVDAINGNFGKIEQMMTRFSDACAVVIVAIGWIADAAINAGSIATENSDLIISVLLGIAAAATVVGAVMVKNALVSAGGWLVAHWPLLLIAAAVTGIIQRTLQMGGTWEDVCGVMGSILYELYAVIYNVVADAWNLFAMFAEFFANFLNNPVAEIVRLVFDAFNWILSVVETVASAIDAVFGQNFAGAVKGVRAQLTQWTNDTFGEHKVQIQRMEKIDYGDAWNYGSKLGKSFYQSVSNLGDMGLGGFDYEAMAGAANTLGAIKDDTSAIKRSVALSEEDMRLLVDMAERQYVNNINLTAQTPIITINGQNTGDSEADLQWLENSLQRILVEQAASHTDKSYQ